MWCDVKRKIAELSGFDKTRQAFGARSHRYQFGPQLSDENIQSWEIQSGVRLPDVLRRFLVECGDGGAGPYYGMKPLKHFHLYNPQAPFLDAEHLRALAKDRYDPSDEDCDYYYEHETYWDVPDEHYGGLVSIIEYGCGEEICCVINGEKTGHMVLKTMEGGLEEFGPLQAAFHRWLDIELRHFERVIAIMDQCSSATELDQICAARHGFNRARDYMVSYLGIEKPVDLFGVAENRYHGATQSPWFDEQFLNWKRGLEIG